MIRFIYFMELFLEIFQHSEIQKTHLFRYRINDPIHTKWYKNLLIMLPTSEDFLQLDRCIDSPLSKEKEGNLPCSLYARKYTNSSFFIVNVIRIFYVKLCLQLWRDRKWIAQASSRGKDFACSHQDSLGWLINLLSLTSRRVAVP